MIETNGKSGYLRKSYDVLSAVLREGAYLNLAMNELADDRDKPLVTKIVYGTIEHFYEIKYILSTLAPKPPKAVIRVIIMQAIYAIKYLEIPNYAILNESVKLTEELNKREMKGFVNAVLQKVAAGKYTLPKDGEAGSEEIKYNLPSWLVARVRADYGNQTDSILLAQGREEEHIRLNRNFPKADFEEKNKNLLVPTFVGGYFTKNTPNIKAMFARGALTYQSLTSMLAVQAFGDLKDKSFLDVCSAPGGKAVYAAELGAKVTACDIHPHRVELIKKYAARMGVKLSAVVSDGTAPRTEWKNAFDCVLVDAPCSGLGVMSKRQDIMLNKTEADITSLVALQKSILSASAELVKVGGILVYSTCTVLKCENDLQIAEFLRTHGGFTPDRLPFALENEGSTQFLPDNSGTDGFFIARLRRVK